MSVEDNNSVKGFLRLSENYIGEIDPEHSFDFPDDPTVNQDHSGKIKQSKDSLYIKRRSGNDATKMRTYLLCIRPIQRNVNSKGFKSRSKEKDYLPLYIFIDCDTSLRHYNNYYFSENPKSASLLITRRRKKIPNEKKGTSVTTVTRFLGTSINLLNT